MSLLLNVTARRQESQKSCWWACMRMVLAYFGRSQPSGPSYYRQALARPWNRPSTPFADHEVLSDGTASMAPYEWYQHGVPMNNRALQRLCQITGFRPIQNLPAFGSWTAELVEEKLRQHGPYLFVGNWNNRGFHAVLVVGREVTNVGPSASDVIDEVMYIDPAMGQRISVNIEHLNSQMRFVGLSASNPLYYPASQPIRETQFDRTP
ncbi:MAG: papain-like cysteine protease family protein [Dehalococcoidia bacterium]